MPTRIPGTLGAAGAALVGRVAGRVVHFIGQVVTARLLGPAAFGIYAVAWVVVRLLAVPGALGLDVGVIRFGADARATRERTNRVLSLSHWIGVLWSGLLGATTALGAPWLSEAMTSSDRLVPGLRLAGLTLPALVALRITASGLRTEGGTAAAVTLEDVLRPGVFLLVVAAMAWGASVTSGRAVAAVCASYWVAALVAAAWTARVRGKGAVVPARPPAKADVLPLIRYGLPVSAASVTAILALQIDQFLIAAILDSTQVGLYAAAVQIAAVFPVVLSALDLALGPRVAAAYTGPEPEDAQEPYRTLAGWGLLLLAPAFAVAVSAPGELLTVLFGGEFASGSTVVIVLAVGFLINASAGGVALVLFLTGFQRDWLKLSVIGAVANAALTIVLTHRIGLVGAALATAFTMSAQNLLGLLYLRARTGFTVWTARYLRCLSIVVTVAAVALAGAAALRSFALAALPFVGLMALASCAATLVLGWLFAMSPGERRAFAGVAGRMLHGRSGARG